MPKKKMFFGPSPLAYFLTKSLEIPKNSITCIGLKLDEKTKLFFFMHYEPAAEISYAGNSHQDYLFAGILWDHPDYRLAELNFSEPYLEPLYQADNLDLARAKKLSIVDQMCLNLACALSHNLNFQILKAGASIEFVLKLKDDQIIFEQTEKARFYQNFFV